MAEFKITQEIWAKIMPKDIIFIIWDYAQGFDGSQSWATDPANYPEYNKSREVAKIKNGNPFYKLRDSWIPNLKYLAWFGASFLPNWIMKDRLIELDCNQINIVGIHECINLKILKITNKISSFTSQDIPCYSHLHGLSPLIELQYLQIRGIGIESISWVENHKKLRYLELMGDNQFNDEIFRVVSKSNITHLIINGLGIQSLRHLKTCHQLQHLEIYKYNGYMDIKNVQHIPYKIITKNSRDGIVPMSDHIKLKLPKIYTFVSINEPNRLDIKNFDPNSFEESDINFSELCSD